MSARIGLVSYVRDEIDIIGPMIAHHRRMGVTDMVIVDNGSVDGTCEALEVMANDGAITLLHDPAHTYSQSEAIGRALTRLIKRGPCDWVVFADADEFFWHPSGSLERALSHYWRGELHCAVVNLIADAQNSSVMYSVSKPHELDPEVPVASYVERPDSLPAPWTLLGQKPKVIAKPKSITSVEMGNHAVERSGWHLGPRKCDIQVLHWPVRSYAQFERKVRNSADALRANASLAPYMGWHARRFGVLLDRGQLRAEYDRLLLRDPGALDAAITDGTLARLTEPDARATFALT